VVLNERLKRKITLALEIIGAILLAVAFILLIRLYVTSPQKTFGKVHNIFKSFEFWVPLVLFVAIAVARLINRDNEKFKAVFRFAVLIFAIFFAFVVLHYDYRADRIVEHDISSYGYLHHYLYTHRDDTCESIIRVLCIIAVILFVMSLCTEVFSLNNLSERQKLLNALSIVAGTLIGLIAFGLGFFGEIYGLFVLFVVLAIAQCFFFVADITSDKSQTMKKIRNVGNLVIILYIVIMIPLFIAEVWDFECYGWCDICKKIIYHWGYSFIAKIEMVVVGVIFYAATIIRLVLERKEKTAGKLNQNDIVNKISELKELFEMGIITETEFTEKKEKLIAEFKEKSNETSK